MNVAAPYEGSAFGRILKGMVDRVPGALGAVFADWEGEPVDQFSHVPALEIQIVGAQWGLVLAQSAPALKRMGAGTIDEMWIETEQAWVLVQRVTDQYFVVLATRKQTHLGIALREIESAAELLRREM